MEKSHQDFSVTADPTLVQNPGGKIGAGRFDYWWLMVAGVIGLVLLLVATRPDPYRRIVLFVRDGIGITVQVTVISFFLVLVVGLIGGVGRISKNPIVNGISTVYVEIVRGIPLLVQLIVWYYAVPAILINIGETNNIAFLKNFSVNPVTMAIVGLTFGYGAYMSEVYRAGIQSISKGQMEAARSLGMTYLQAMRYVILPQALRVILPPVGNEFISLLKDSSLVSAVSVPDMTRRGREFMSATFNPIDTWIMVALLYLIMTLISARIVFWIERKTRLEK